jgi:hypothetical protein
MKFLIRGFIVMLVSGCCVYQPRPYPWNLPPASEWNQPFETSWQNVVDMYHRMMAPKKKVWDPVMQNYQQDLSCDYQ